MSAQQASATAIAAHHGQWVVEGCTSWTATTPPIAAVYPAAKKGQELLTTAPDYFSNQAGFWKQATTISGTARGFTFGPNVNVDYSAYKDAFDKAVQDKSSFTNALSSMHNATVADMQKSGFKLAS